MHIITILFQSARRKKLAADVLPLSVMTSKLATWEKEWSERDISTFMYGIRSLPCVSKEEFEFLENGGHEKFPFRKRVYLAVRLATPCMGYKS